MKTYCAYEKIFKHRFGDPKKSVFVLYTKNSTGQGKNALLETKISLEMASRELSKFIDVFQIARTDEEKANVLNQCIRYLAQNCVSNLQLSQLANCQSELTQPEPINLYDR